MENTPLSLYQKKDIKHKYKSHRFNLFKEANIIICANKFHTFNLFLQYLFFLLDSTHSIYLILEKTSHSTKHTRALFNSRIPYQIFVGL